MDLLSKKKKKKRVLSFPNARELASNATAVFGQESFMTDQPGSSFDSIDTPIGLQATSAGLYIADTKNNRAVQVSKKIFFFLTFHPIDV